MSKNTCPFCESYPLPPSVKPPPRSSIYGTSWYPDRDVDPSLEEHRSYVDGWSLWSCRACDNYFLVCPELKQLVVIPSRHREVVTGWYESRPLVGAEHAEALARIGGVPASRWPHRSWSQTYPCRCTTKARERLDFCILSVQEFPPVVFLSGVRLLLIDEIDRIELSQYALRSGIRHETRTAREEDREFRPTVVVAPDGSEFILNGGHHFFATKTWKGAQMRLGRPWSYEMGRDTYRTRFPVTWIFARGIVCATERAEALGSAAEGRVPTATADGRVLLPQDLIRRSLDEHAATTLYNRGVALGKLGRDEEAIAVYDEVDARFGERDELELAQPAAAALVNKGLRLEALGRRGQAIAVYDRVEARFGGRGEPVLAEQVVKALFCKGVCLGASGRDEEALAIYDEIVARFGERDEPAIAARVAKALFNKGVLLGRLGRSGEEYAAYEEVVTRFGGRDERAVAAAVAYALGNMGVGLWQLDRHEEAITVFEDVVARFGEREELPFARNVAKALVAKGLALRSLGREAEAIAACDEAVARFGGRDEPAIVDLLVEALDNKCRWLVTLGSRSEAGSESRRRYWQEAEQSLIAYARRSGKPLRRVYDYARFLALRGELPEALQALEECLEAGAVSARSLRRDPDWKVFRSRPEFEDLLRRYESRTPSKI